MDLEKVLMGDPSKTQDAPVVIIKDVEKHRVTCPHCWGIGYAIIEIHRKSGGTDVKGLAEGHKCNFCNKWFKIKASVKLVGVPMPKTGSNGLTVEKIYKELTDGS